MTIEKQIKLAKLNMVGTGILAIIALVGSMVLAHMGIRFYSWVWLTFGLINILTFWINLKTYRRYVP